MTRSLAAVVAKHAKILGPYIGYQLLNSIYMVLIVGE